MAPTPVFETLLYHTQGSICTITLNRPAVHNALSQQLIADLTAAVARAGADEAARVVVLTGAGERAFSSGADLKEGMAGTGRARLSETLRKGYNPLIMSLRSLPKPVICRLNGVAAGAGCSLALACDVIVAADSAALSQIFVGIGLIMDAGSSYFLPRLVGSARAFELCSTGRMVPAAEAAALGLVSQVVPAAQLDAAVAKLARQYANAPTRAIGLMKQVLNQSHESTLAQMLELEAVTQDLAGDTTDSQEGIRAFLEKRLPHFTGK